MRSTSKQWLKELSDVLTPISIPSQEYQFFSIEGFDPNKYALAVYKLKHSDCWTMAFQDPERPNVWLQFGHLPNIKLEDITKSNIANGWRNDCGETLKHGYDNPTLWVRDLVQLMKEAA